MGQQNVLVNGTNYKIIGGRTLINGTGYDIKSGNTCIGGTSYPILVNKEFVFSEYKIAGIATNTFWNYTKDSSGLHMVMTGNVPYDEVSNRQWGGWNITGDFADGDRIVTNLSYSNNTWDYYCNLLIYFGDTGRTLKVYYPDSTVQSETYSFTWDSAYGTSLIIAWYQGSDIITTSNLTLSSITVNGTEIIT